MQQYIKIIVCLLMLVLVACSGATSKGLAKGQHAQGKFKRIAFPSEIPLRGHYAIDAVVSNINRCPARSQCLIADHLNIISPAAHKPYVKAQTLLVFPPDVTQFNTGQHYRFLFTHAQYVDHKKLIPAKR